MYKPEKQNTDEPVCLLDRIKADPTRALLESTLAEMRQAEDEIHASLALTVAKEDTAILQALLGATELAIVELGRVSESLGKPVKTGFRT